MFSTLEAALNLADKGLRVFPIVPGGRKPLHEKFQFNATKDPARIREWWAQPDCQGCNVGVLTTDMVVVDLDMKKGKDGISSYNAIQGATYETLVVKTPSGGFHLYFEGPDSGLRVNALPGVDIRSHNGYVVGPGSWTQELPGQQSEGWYQVVADKPLAWVPIGAEGFLKPPRSAVSRADNFAALDTPAAIASAAAWLATAEPAVEGQGGDDHTYRIAAKLVRDFALTTDAAHTLLCGPWNERCSPPWSPADLWLKLTNAQEYAAGDLGSAQPAIHFNGVSVEAPPPYTPPALPSAAERGVHMGNLPDPSTIKPRPWKVQGLFMSRDVTVLAGVGAAGKSMLQLTAAAHFSLGKDFGPWKLAVPGVPLRTVIYNAEDDIEEQGRRVFGICALYNFDYQEVRKNIAIIDDSAGEINLAYLENRQPKQNEVGVSFIVNTLADLNADIAMFDPLLNIHTLDENDNPQMRFFITLMRNIARVTNTSVMLAHHSTKGAAAKDKGDVDAIRGAGAIVNSSRLALLVSPVTKDEAEAFGITRSAHKYIRVDSAKANYQAASKQAMAYFEWNTVSTPFVDKIGVPYAVDVATKENSERVRLSSMIVDAMLVEHSASMTRNAACDILQKTDDLMRNLSKTTLYRRLDDMLRTPVDTPKGTLSRVNDALVLS